MAPPDPLAPDKIDVSCPSCHRTLRVRREYLGRTVSCRHCDHSFVASIQPGGESLPNHVEPPTGRLDAVESRLGRVELDRDQGRVEFLDLASRVRSLQGEIESFRQQDETNQRERTRSDEAVRIAVEERSVALEIRLLGLENSARDEIRSGHRIEERLQTLESSEKIPAAIESEFLRIVERLQKVSEHQAGHLDRLEAVEADRDALRSELADRRSEQARRDSEEAGRSERFQAELERLRSELAALRSAPDPDPVASSETITAAIETEFHRILGVLQEVNDQQAGLLDRLEAVEADRDALRSELADRRSEQARRDSEEAGRSERLQAELERLRSELAALRSAQVQAPDPVATEPGPAKVEIGAGIAGTSPKGNAASVDRRAHDLILDRFFNPDERIEVEDLATGPATSSVKLNFRGPMTQSTGLDPTVIAGDYRRRGDEYARSMSRRDVGAAIQTARDLIRYAAEHYGDRSIEVSLWLRNLGMSQSIGGQHAEARDSLQRAREISEGLGEAGKLALAICLIDLTQSYLISGDRRQASSICEQALGALKELQLPPNNPLLIRARESMARIRAGESGASTFGSITIST